MGFSLRLADPVGLWAEPGVRVGGRLYRVDVAALLVSHRDDNTAPPSVVRRSRSRKRPKDAPTHVRSWALRPDLKQAKVIRTRFRTGVRVYNAVLGEFLDRARAVKADPAWQAARELPLRDRDERKARSAAFRSVEAAYRFDRGAAQSFASSLRKVWVREHLPAQEVQNLGSRAFDAVRQWHLGKRGKPRFKSVIRGLHSLSAKDGQGRPRTATAPCGRRPATAVGWWVCSGVRVW